MRATIGHFVINWSCLYFWNRSEVIDPVKADGSFRVNRKPKATILVTIIAIHHCPASHARPDTPVICATAESQANGLCLFLSQPFKQGLTRSFTDRWRKLSLSRKGRGTKWTEDQCPLTNQSWSLVTSISFENYTQTYRCIQILSYTNFGWLTKSNAQHRWISELLN